MSSSSTDAVDPSSCVMALHDVLFAELGDWTPTNDEDIQNLAQYRVLAQVAQQERRVWCDLVRSKKRDGRQVENACRAMEEAEELCLSPLFRILHRQRRSALCLSGGGIRSATFALGVIHALAKYSYEGEPKAEPAKLLAQFDFLSTVSGGGYIGAWLSSWMTHEGSTEKVVRQLASTPTDKLDPEPKQLLHLREYSNYLNPRLGLFSADTWTLVATALRNIILNWFVLIPFLAAALLLPELFRNLLLVRHDILAVFLQPVLVAAFSLGVIGTSFIMYNLPSFGDGRLGTGGFLVFCALPLTLSALCTTLWWGWQTELDSRSLPGWYFAAFGAAMHCGGVTGGVLVSLVRRSPNFRKGRFKPIRLAFAFAAAIATGALGAWLFSFVAGNFHPGKLGISLYACLGFPLVSSILASVGVLSVGIGSKVTDDDDREWWSRAGAWVLIIATTWLLFSALVLLLPQSLIGVLHRWPISFSTAGAAIGWLVSRAGRSPKTGPRSRGDQSAGEEEGIGERIRSLLVPVAALAFLVALTCAITLANQELGRKLYCSVPLLLFIELLVAILMSYGVNVNKFSLHAMYRMRLVRAYLGASHSARNPNPFTGFDPGDNLAMYQLYKGKPMHVLNLCLNLVRGNKLAWQQRRAEPFTVTRLHSGSLRVGYQSSVTYGQGPTIDGISLGTAMTISGAAASPNMGYHSSPLMALIMTLFNARLGWWLANPGEPGRRFWNKSGPAFGVRPILDEALGNTTDDNRYVYLSDGGHFENLGIYEMVLRRCHYIVVVDASSDPHYTMEDLGNAVRKIRIDLGIPIEFPDGLPTDPGAGSAARHCAVGRVRYDCVDSGAPDGWIVYIKPLLTGDEPADVANYKSANSSFPQQPTADQWFDESQFESYRRLGAHSIEAILGNKPQAYSVPEFFLAVQDYLGVSAKPYDASIWF